MIWPHRVKYGGHCGVKEAKGVHPLIDQQFSYVRLAAPLLDTVGSVLSFAGRSVLGFVSHICCYAVLATR